MATESDVKETDLIHGGIFLLAAFLEGKPREVVNDLMDSGSEYFDQNFKMKFEEAQGTKKKHPFEGKSPVDKYEYICSTKGHPNRLDQLSSQAVRDFVIVRNKLVSRGFLAWAILHADRFTKSFLET